jgi:hypothetical protein
MSVSDYADYEGLLQLARNAGEMLAKTWIPRLCEQLKKENPEMPNEDVKDIVTRDCSDIWSKATIRKFIPEEYKDPQKQAAIKKRYEKQLEEPIPVGINPTENSSVSQTEQESESFENVDRGPNVKKESQTVHQLQNELKNVRESLEARLEEEREKLKFAQDPDNLQKVPDIVDDKIGPVKVQNLARVSEFEKRGFQILAGRYTEIIRRKFAVDSNARISFCVIAKDKTTGIESLVPVKFIIDMDKRTAEVILDEGRL